LEATADGQDRYPVGPSGTEQGHLEGIPARVGVPDVFGTGQAVVLREEILSAGQEQPVTGSQGLGGTRRSNGWR
jgi:hypothetical protein